jgi:hypothetical protein
MKNKLEKSSIVYNYSNYGFLSEFSVHRLTDNREIRAIRDYGQESFL